MKDLERLEAKICKQHKITPAQLKGPCREKHLVNARIDFSVQARALGYSYPAIGRYMKRDHSTIINHIWIAEERNNISK